MHVRTMVPPMRMRYLFGILTLAFVVISITFNIVAISITFNMAIVSTMLKPLLTPSSSIIMPKNNKTIAIYICNDLYNEMQIQKIQELQSYFNKNLYVATDAQNIQNDWKVLPMEQIISPALNITLTTKLALSPPPLCCSIERTIMWLILNQDLYDHVWVMEDDVLWTNFTDLKNFFISYRNDDTDLLHPNYGMEEHSYNFLNRWTRWRFLQLPHVSTSQAAFKKPFHQGLFMIYRLSSRFVTALNDWRLKNNDEWVFFEPLFANLAYRKDLTTKLTTKNFINNSIGYNFQVRWRPCFSFEEVYNETSRSSGSRGGIFHPVKKDAMSENCRQKQRVELNT